MKNVLLAVMLLVTIAALAQSGGLSLQTPVQALTGCPAPVAGMNTACSGPDGWYVASGTAALAKLAPGSSGPAGPPGPAGPAGPAGPVWATCTGVTLTPSGVGVYTLTVVPANCK